MLVVTDLTATAVAVTAAGDLAATAAADLLPTAIPDEHLWPARLGGSPRELRLADRQTRLLTRTLIELVALQPDLDRDRTPLQVAVGPARTDLPGMARWADRIAPGEPLPMIQPAAALGLLPNTPLSWLATKVGWRGEGGVWAGFAAAGHEALIAAALAIDSGSSSSAVAAAVNCPDPWFVPATLEHDLVTPVGPVTDAGVAIRLARPSDTGARTVDGISTHRFSPSMPAGTDQRMQSALPDRPPERRLLSAAAAAGGTGRGVPRAADPGPVGATRLRALASRPPGGDAEAVITPIAAALSLDPRLLRSRLLGWQAGPGLSPAQRWGDALTATLPLAVALATAGAFGPGWHALWAQDAAGGARLAVVQVEPRSAGASR